MTEEKKLSRQELEDLVIETDSGARRPDNFIAATILLATAFIWSLFQIWVASPLPFETNFLILDDTKKRSIHLGFAIFLAFIAYPAFSKSPRRRIPLVDWVFAILGAFCATYIFAFYDELSTRPGIVHSYFLREFYPLLNYICDEFGWGKPGWLPDNNNLPKPGFDFEVALIGMILLLEATRRSLGLPLLIIALIFLFYSIFGSYNFIPDLIRYKGASPEKIASHQWLTTEGVFGIALGVSASFVFLFVLFGSLLEKAGAGNYFIQVAFSILGHLRGGPAKAAVLSSGMTGLISGSSIANTVTTGTFTIPLMKRVGFSGSKAGAVEVASSVNGQIMPPVMGAAAFLMVEYVGIPYTAVVKHAFLPALISYIALLYMVHLEALKGGMKALEKPVNRNFMQSILVYGISISSIFIIAGLSFIVFGAIRDSSEFIANNFFSAPDFIVENSFLFSMLILLSIYILAIRYAAKFPDLEQDDPESEMLHLPKTLPTVITGIHYILPIAVLIWCLMIDRLSPGLSAFWATAFMVFIILTQKPIKAFFRKQHDYTRAFKESGIDFIDGMISGARNMIGIAVATAAAGIIVGSVSLTGVGQVLTEVVEALAGGSIILILLLTAVICLILGMGLPTTANYIVVASLMAKVVVDLGTANGLIVPLIAVHLFVFYFGIMADVTPPVGLASFAAAAISGDDPIRTGVQAFTYSLRTAILPFFFIFNTELILVGIDNFWEASFVFLYATAAILIFSSGLQGYLITRNKLLESVVLMLVALTLFVPSFWFKVILPSYEEKPISELAQVVEKMPETSRTRLTVTAYDFEDQKTEFTAYIPGNVAGESGAEKVKKYGLTLEPVDEQGKAEVSFIAFNSDAEKGGFNTVDLDRFYVTKVEVPSDPGVNPKILFIPALLLFGLVLMIQSVRKKKEFALAS
jgi:TRAP transporter 4TM/12TM fusion protein